MRIADRNIGCSLPHPDLTRAEYRLHLAVRILVLADLAERHRETRVLNENDYDFVAVVVVDLGADVDLSLDIAPDNIAQSRSVESMPITDRALRHAGVAVVIDADQDVSARRPIGHRDDVLDELQLVFRYVEVDTLLVVEVVFLRLSKEFQEFLVVGSLVRTDDHSMPSPRGLLPSAMAPRHPAGKDVST